MLDRSAAAYIAFSKAPLEYARQRIKPSDFLALTFELPIDGYVLKADIAAFYQFVDHDILAGEMIAQGCNFTFVEPLIELLQEVQGRRFGIPQLLEPSDHLSEIYIDRVERRMLQLGYGTWRFNDDFRIICETYTDVLKATEALSLAARDNGLSINESKIKAVQVFGYLNDTFGLEATPAGLSALDDVETLVGDYTDDFAAEDGDKAEAAAKYIGKAAVHGNDDASVDLTSVGPDTARLMRRAINALSAAQNAEPVGNLSLILAYVPSITPWIFNYLASLRDTALASAEDAVSAVITNLSLNEWQEIWVADTIRQLGSLRAAEGAHHAEFSAWLTSVRARTQATVSAAYATWTLAEGGQLDAHSLLTEAAEVPATVAPIYTSALDAAFPRPRTEEVDKRLRALARSDIQAKVLLAL